MSKNKPRRKRYKPNFIMIPPAASPPDAAGGVPPDAPPDAMSAAQAALARAAAAAAGGDLFKADRESRLAERLDRLGRRAREDAPPVVEEENDPEAFRLDLERRINRRRIVERESMDKLKRENPAAWQQAYEAALVDAQKCIRQVEEFWTGDPRLFEEPEGGYPPEKVV